MEISRRKFIQAVAAAPLATVPTIVFGDIDRLPTPREVLENGENITVTCEWNDEEMLELAAYCAAFSYVDYKGLSNDDLAGAGGDKLHAGFSNYIHFMLNNADPTYAVFGVKAMLTHYTLPIVPFRTKAFDRFHKEAGDYIVQAVEYDHPLAGNEMAEKIKIMLKDGDFIQSRLPSLMI